MHLFLIYFSVKYKKLLSEPQTTKSCLTAPLCTKVHVYRSMCSHSVLCEYLMPLSVNYKLLQKTILFISLLLTQFFWQQSTIVVDSEVISPIFLHVVVNKHTTIINMFVLVSWEGAHFSAASDFIISNADCFQPDIFVKSRNFHCKLPATILQGSIPVYCPPSDVNTAM